MIEVKGNLWTFPPVDAFRVITTNGFVKKNGECVMGKGCAAEAKKKYPRLPSELGFKIKEAGNLVRFFPEYGLFSFPVKHNWWEVADLNLITESAVQLEAVARADPDHTFILPRPGCGNGQLLWEDVRPLLLDLPDNVLVITF